MDQITRNFYLGSVEDSENIELLRQHNIRCVVNCAKEVSNAYPGIFWYLNIPLRDPDADIESYFGTVLHQLNLIRDTPTLIHCKMGISRSVTILTFFLSTVFDVPWREVLSEIKLKRCVANPHSFFLSILDKVLK